MSDYAARDYSYWDVDDREGDAFGFAEEHRPLVRRPITPYSKRASLLHEIRTHAKAALASADEDLVAPTPAAQEAAARVINAMPEGCLDFRLAISHSGEINFFFGREAPTFQMLIDEDGLLSYFGKFGAERFGDSDIEPGAFPYWQLLRLLGAH